MTRRAAIATAGSIVAGAIALGGCTSSLPTPVPADVMIDGHAIGGPRSVSGDEFHRIETTARAFAAATWPGHAMTGDALVEPGTGPGSSAGPAGDPATTFLVVLDLTGGERHAIVVSCDAARFPAPDSCTASR